MVVPQGFRWVLSRLRDEYGNPRIFISENGFSTNSSFVTDDTKRINYLETYLSALRESIYTDGCSVMGYIFWSLLDNFEWTSGYTYGCSGICTHRSGTRYANPSDNATAWGADGYPLKFRGEQQVQVNLGGVEFDHTFLVFEQEGTGLDLLGMDILKKIPMVIRADRHEVTLLKGDEREGVPVAGVRATETIDKIDDLPDGSGTQRG
ncbi:hypothetical protein GE061_009644 [Apolygus lucorum]|uniref:Glycoside hydrolase family 1 n=1 Tax=Apolygus lucorum TaxID=248454 RepID=A0A8S9Y2B7_APOLU|nr:hypothetical protein GE061_009644 [Apolygus lucorum]